MFIERFQSAKMSANIRVGSRNVNLILILSSGADRVVFGDS